MVDSLPRARQSSGNCPPLLRRVSVLLAALGLTLTNVGCAGHAAKTQRARDALDAGKPKEALKLYNDVLRVSSKGELPAKPKKNDSLFVLDRALIFQALSAYEQSSRDLQYADKELEMLDMSRTAVADIGKYVFSDDSGPYKSAPYEKVMINTMNMINYLARDDLSGARVEARRLSIMQKYLRDTDAAAENMNAPGGYLAGFVFEKSGRPDIALRYYDEALEYGDFPSLVQPVYRLREATAFWTPRLEKFLERHKASLPQVARATAAGHAHPETHVDTAAQPAAGAQPVASTQAIESAEPTAGVQAAASAPPATSTPAPASTQSPEGGSTEPAELLIIVNYGRVPAKIAKRIPIGLALTYASLFMSAANQATANRLAAQGLVTWINYPELEAPYRPIRPPTVAVDGAAQRLDPLAAIDMAARKAYDDARGPIVAAAVTRMIARVIAGEAAGAAGKAATNDDIIGALISIGTQATLTAADTPDTRSWVTLPARMDVTRLSLPPGRHVIDLAVHGRRERVTVDLEPGGWQAVTITALR